MKSIKLALEIESKAAFLSTKTYQAEYLKIAQIVSRRISDKFYLVRKHCMECVLVLIENNPYNSNLNREFYINEKPMLPSPLESKENRDSNVSLSASHQEEDTDRSSSTNHLLFEQAIQCIDLVLTFV